MSFSVSFIGSPEGIRRRLAETSEQLTGASKEEFDAVKPSLETILDQQVGVEGTKIAVKLDASGHAYFKDGVKQYGTCSVEIRQIGQLAE